MHNTLHRCDAREASEFQPTSLAINSACLDLLRSSLCCARTWSLEWLEDASAIRPMVMSNEARVGPSTIFWLSSRPSWTLSFLNGGVGKVGAAGASDSHRWLASNWSTMAWIGAICSAKVFWTICSTILVHSAALMTASWVCVAASIPVGMNGFTHPASGPGPAAEWVDSGRSGLGNSILCSRASEREMGTGSDLASSAVKEWRAWNKLRTRTCH